MQSKKRAKPVKFGKKTTPEATEKAEEQLKKIEEEAEEIKKRVEELEKEEDEVVDELAASDDSTEDSGEGEADVDEGEPPHHHVEAHYSSVETLDIKEIPDEDEKIDLSEPKEGTEVPESEETDQEEATDANEEADDNPQAEEKPVGEEEEIVEDVNPAVVGQDGAFFNAPPDAYDSKKSTFPYFFKIALVAFFLGLVFFGGIYYAVSNNDFKSFIPSFSETEPTETPPEPTPTEEPVDLSKYTVRVLNGTGEAGVAASVRDELKGAGFNVVSIGNADDADATEIVAIEEVEDEFLNKLKEALQSTYEVKEVTREATAAADIVITIGGEASE
jgi:TolA-binding protein